MSFLNLNDKTFLIMGVANKKSVATHVASLLLDEGAHCIFTVQKEEQLEVIRKLFPQSPALVCDVSEKSHLLKLKEFFSDKKINGLLHSLAYAKFTTPNFHETPREDFLEATQVSAYSLVEVTHALMNSFKPEASVVTISISNTKATSYGYLGPIKALLDAEVPYLAKSTHLRVNAVAAGPLKTSASAGIPGYVEQYLYAEAMTLRKKALETEEVAKAAVFLLSTASSGMNGTSLLIDAGMHCNAFDQDIVKNYHQGLKT
jgi:enoyl-[acyl-carrier protein] reductase I